MVLLPKEELSYWRRNMVRPIYPELADGLEADVAIIGGGITGLTAGYLLKKAGKTVAIIEKDTIASGTTGNTTGKVTSQHGLTYADLSERLGKTTAQAYGKANEAAIAQIEALVKKEKIDCDWQRDDNYVYTCDALQIKKYWHEAAVAARLGLPASFEKTSALPFAIAGAVRFRNQAKFHSAKYAAALAARIHGHGSQVFENTRAVGIRDGAPGRIKTPNGTVQAQDIIVATNVPTLPLVARGAYCVLEYPLKSYVVAARTKTKLRGMYISTDDDEYSILPVQSGTENLLLIGGESHIRGAKLNVETRYDRLAVYAKYRFRAPIIDYKWSAWDYRAYDDIPLVGKMYPWSKHLYVATAFRKWGLSNSMVAGTILRDLLAGQKNDVAEMYTPMRSSAIRSIPRVAKQYLMG
jgi:glycine/D-amino acid oxidase-like deaminating enzyme